MSPNSRGRSPVEAADARTPGAEIRVRDLSKVFETSEGTERVFEGIDFDVEAGSFVTLLGVSGSGKSTILNILSGILQPTGGEVEFETGDGSEVEIGHVFQSPRLLPWRTCVENIMFVNEDNPDFTRDDAREHLDMVGLEGHYEKYPTQLSGGQQQRVGIARALSIDPQVLLMDEPFSNLDEMTAESLRQVITELWQQLNKTIVFVTHDINEAVELADRILMVGNGDLYADFDVSLDRPRQLDSEAFLAFRKKAIERFHDRPGA